MNFNNITNFFFLKQKSKFFIAFISIFIFIIFPDNSHAISTNSGKILFENHCAGCHLNGGNIIRRSKNLKISSLRRNGIDNPEVIAKIASQGIGIMDGYKDLLGDNGDQIVANWIWERAQNAWVQE